MIELKYWLLSGNYAGIVFQGGALLRRFREVFCTDTHAKHSQGLTVQLPAMEILDPVKVQNRVL